jgi:hypothetical protein
MENFVQQSGFDQRPQPSPIAHPQPSVNGQTTRPDIHLLRIIPYIIYILLFPDIRHLAMVW